jgi:Protein of unknown function (DUF2939)
MVGRKPLIGALVAVGLGYGIYPYLTLYRLGQAIRHGDAATLESMVDWPAVREGIKEDICDLVIDQPQPAQAGGQLPPFGAGFVRGIATNVVDKQVTPEGLVAAAQQPDAAQPSEAAVKLGWAFFDGPSAFVVDLTTPQEATPIRLQMALRNGAWQVTRVWLPPEMLARSHTRT